MPAAGNTQVRPLLGGTQIESRNGTGTVRTGTLGLPLVLNGDEMCFVTAGHCLFDAGTSVGQPVHGSAVGTVQANHLAAGADIGIVRVAGTVAIAAAQVWTGAGSSITVRAAFSGLPTRDQPIVLQGAVSGTLRGTVVAPEADINDADTGQRVTNVVLVRWGGGATSAAGDSGGPCMDDLLDGATCWGVYGGRAVVQGVTYGWFTPFDNIEW